MAGLLAAFMFPWSKQGSRLPRLLCGKFALRKNSGQRHFQSAQTCGHAELWSDLLDASQSRHQHFGDMFFRQSLTIAIGRIVVLQRCLFGKNQDIGSKAGELP